MPSLTQKLFEKYISRGVQNALRQLRDQLPTQRLHKASVKKAERLSSTTKHRLNLASGPNRKEGWINIDPTDGVDLQLGFARDRTLALILERAGFVQVNRRDFGPALDSESRRIGTLYMKARKPDRFQAA